MPKVILKLNLGSGKIKLESMKCKSSTRAAELAGKRPNCIDYEFIEDGHSPRRLYPKPKPRISSFGERIASGEINMSNIEQMLK